MRNNQSKLQKAAWAALPVGCALVSGFFVAPRDARATGTWIGSASTSWGDVANWVGSAPLPPGVAQATNGAAQGDVWIGNNGTVFYNNFMAGSGTIVIGRIRLGYNAPGTTNPGTGILNMDAGSLSTQQFNTFGDGAVGTINITGGMLDLHGTDNTKDTVFGFTSDAVINLSAGTLITSQYGLEQGGGFSTFNMSGGQLRMGQLDSATSRAELGAEADFFSFTGGEIFQPRAMTIHHVAGNGSITSEVNGASAITFDIAGNDTWAGRLNAGSASVGILAKNGPGTLTLTAAQGYERGTNVQAGTLVLDYSAAPSILTSVSSISMQGGTLVFKGNSSGQAVAKLNANNGGSTVIADPNAGATTLSFGSMARTVGATVDFKASSGVLGTDVLMGTTTGNNANGIVGAWATVNGGADWAFTQGGIIKPYAGYDTTNAFSDATVNYAVSSPATISAAGLANSVKLTGSAGINLSGGSLVLTSGGILANTTGSLSGGTLTSINGVGTAATAESDVIVVTPTNFSMSSIVTDNASGSVSLTKTGAGVLTLTGASTYTGSTYIDGGTLKLGAATVLPNNNTVVMSTGPNNVLDLNGFSPTLNAINGGAVDNSAGGIGTMTPPTGGGEVKVGGGTLTLTLSNGGTMSYGGNLTGTGNVVFTAGVATLSSSNSSFNGTIRVTNGAVLGVTNVANAGTNSALGSAGAASNLVLDGGTLRYAARVGGSTDRLFTIGQNGGTLEAYGFSGTNHSGAYGMVRFTNPGAIVMAGPSSTRNFTLAGSGGTFTSSASIMESSLAAAIPDAGAGGTVTLIKNGTVQWLLTNPASTYTGPTQINAGTLAVTTLANGGQPSSIGASSNSANNLSISSATLRYVGAGGSTDRLANVGGASAGFDSSGTGPINFSNTGSLSGGSQIVLTGSNTGANTFAPQITGGSLVKSGPGAWTVTGSSSYSALTQITGGTLSINSLSNGGLPSPIGQASSDAANIFIGGGALNYVGAAASSDRLFSLTSSGTISSSGTGPINLNNTGAMGFGTTTGGRTLGLGGTNTGLNTLAAVVGDAGGGTVTSVAKSGPGTWVLTGANNYTGATTVTGGKLVLVGPAKAPVLTGNGGVINGGRLVLDYNDDATVPATVKSVLTTGYGQTPKFSSGALRTSNAADPAKGLGWKNDTAAKQVSVGYTYYGDANLDGQVDVTDLGALATNWQTSNVWSGGDFNYDGFVDVSDLGALATNWQLGVGNPLGPGSLDAAMQSVGLGNVSVPEPASMGIIGMCVMGIASSRRARVRRRR
jgi:fibronectin-binding autotransporter adhesin